MASAWETIVVLIITALLHSRPANARPQAASPPILTSTRCGYESCHEIKKDMINVHLVPHTHDDVGWLKTVDQYYYGSQSLIQKAGVQYILDSVIHELLKDANKRFIYVESAFFFKWWREQTADIQEKVKQLVNEGRLEFIGGAWSMNDEATTHYQSVIDQFAWGLRRLNDTFGTCSRPRIGWQIDPFGHSREMASMFAQMGFDGLFFGRLDYQDKKNRLNTKTAEMIWRASSNLGESSHLFTGALYNHYQPPPGFCFDILCADEPIIDAKHSPDNNVNSRISDFFKFVNEQSAFYRSNNIIVTMGGDFTYQDANVFYKNLDKLIRYANERQSNGSKINLLYSTPSCYLNALHEAGLTWPTKDDDFFPYASDPHAYWTGYFSSRPTIKRYERVGNHFLQVCKQMTALAPIQRAEFLPHLSFMRETMGVMQHHDAITGTEKQKVAYDYARRLTVGLRACSTNTKTVLNFLSNDKEPQLEFRSCRLLNISRCSVSQNNDQFILTLYNPLAHESSEYVRVPVKSVEYEVRDYKGEVQEIQYVPVPKAIKKLSYRTSTTNYELVFFAAQLPPLGYKSYYIARKPSGLLPPVPDPDAISDLTTIGNKYIHLTFDTNGFLKSVSVANVTRFISQEFLYYEAATGNNREFLNRSSGAYIFRPNGDYAHSIAQQPTMVVYRGSLVEEVHQTFNSSISQVVRLYRDQRYAEFEWLVGPINVEDNIGKEVITRFNANIKSQGVFYTDSNGREMIERQQNHRDTWKVQLAEKNAGNYYPVTTKIALEDDVARLALLTDRAQGGSSLADGSLELMVHRRLLHDDAFGVGEALNETAYGEGLVARGTHYLVFGSSQTERSPTTQALERLTQLEKHLPSWKFFSNANAIPYDLWLKEKTNMFIGIEATTLPRNIHLLTLEPWHEGEILVRFEHIFEKDEDPEYSKTVSFNVKDVLTNVKIKDIRETTLDGNEWLGDRRRLEFVPDPEPDDDHSTESPPKARSLSSDEIPLLRAEKPILAAKYSEEWTAFLQAHEKENNVLKRDIATPKELNRMRAQRLSQLPKRASTATLKDGDPEFIIDLEPMQIRTFILSLQERENL